MPRMTCASFHRRVQPERTMWAKSEHPAPSPTSISSPGSSAPLPSGSSAPLPSSSYSCKFVDAGGKRCEYRHYKRALDCNKHMMLVHGVSEFDNMLYPLQNRKRQRTSPNHPTPSPTSIMSPSSSVSLHHVHNPDTGEYDGEDDGDNEGDEEDWIEDSDGEWTPHGRKYGRV